MYGLITNRGQRINLARMLEGMFDGSDDAEAPKTADGPTEPTPRARPSRERIREMARLMAEREAAREAAGVDVFGEPLRPEPPDTAPRRPTDLVGLDAQNVDTPRRV